MPRSLANGDYSLLMAVESSSRPDSWYRVLTDRQTGALSCDCPPWLFKQDAQSATTGTRSCEHTRLAQLLTQAAPVSTGLFSQRSGPALATVAPASLLLAAQRQWPGLRGQWSIDGRVAEVNGKPYQFLLVSLAMGNGGSATGVVAFAERHHPTLARLQAGVAGWAGYAIAAEVARQGGYPLAGQPPEHFKVPAARSRRQTPGGAPQPAPATQPVVPRFGLRDILQVGDQTDLGDGLQPTQRAENTLRMFLGEQLYQQLETRHFLDVSSVRYAAQQRVYRVRRDPLKRDDRRVRVFELGSYINDFCIIRAQEVPEADHWLTVWLGLLSDERATLSVVQRYNVFGQYSDVRLPVVPLERETVPAIWQPRVA